MKKTKLILLILISLVNFKIVNADESFNQWLDNFKIRAVKSGISKETVDLVMNKAIFLRSLSLNGFSERHTKISGCIPIERSSLTEC